VRNKELGSKLPRVLRLPFVALGLGECDLSLTDGLQQRYAFADADPGNDITTGWQRPRGGVRWMEEEVEVKVQ